MCIDHGGADVAMAQEFLHRANVVTGFQKMRGETVPKGVRCGVFGYSRFGNRSFHRLLNMGFVKMVTAQRIVAGYERHLLCRKKELPGKLTTAVFIFVLQLIRHERTLKARFEVTMKKLLQPFKMARELGQYLFRQKHFSEFASFAIDCNDPLIEIKIANAKIQGLI